MILKGKHKNNIRSINGGEFQKDLTYLRRLKALLIMNALWPNRTSIKYNKKNNESKLDIFDFPGFIFEKKNILKIKKMA